VSTACPVCGGGSFVLHREVHSALSEIPAGLDRGPVVRARIERCTDCGLFRTVHLSETRSAAALYEHDSICFDASVSKVSVAGRESAGSSDELTLLDRLPPANLLDVGCGAGHFLLRAAARGYTVTGIDLDGRAVDYVRGELHLDAHRGTLDALDGARRFDVITAFGVLEHLDDPRSFLQAARDRLAPGGEILIGVPNARSVNRWVARLSRHDWDMFLEPGHLYHYDIGSLAKLACRAGLRPSRWGTATMAIRGKVPVLPHRFPALERSVRAFTQRPAIRRGYRSALAALDRVRLGDMLFAVFEPQRS
jgi:SAM-dependent methyltransferase